MRKGYDPKIFLTPKGEVLAIATGSDACTEHECGSREMQDSLCAASQYNAEPALIGQLRAGNSVDYPSVLARKAIDQNLQNIRFLSGTDSAGSTIAAIVFEARSPGGRAQINDTELSVSSDEDVAGAWDEGSFGFKVVGDKLALKLKTFFDALQAGDGIFAGTFFADTGKDRASGVIIARKSQLRPEHLANVKKAQLDYESNLQLKALSRESELACIMRSQPDRRMRLGFIWPVWQDGVAGSPVLYAVNPDYDSQKLVPYFGPYTFDMLKDWVLAEKKYALKPVNRPAKALDDATV